MRQDSVNIFTDFYASVCPNELFPKLTALWHSCLLSMDMSRLNRSLWLHHLFHFQKVEQKHHMAPWEALFLWGECGLTATKGWVEKSQRWGRGEGFVVAIVAVTFAVIFAMTLPTEDHDRDQLCHGQQQHPPCQQFLVGQAYAHKRKKAPVPGGWQRRKGRRQEMMWLENELFDDNILRLLSRNFWTAFMLGKRQRDPLPF